jgi:hypothetical protein
MPVSEMRQRRIRKPRPRARTYLDLRTPSGRTLPY